MGISSINEGRALGTLRPEVAKAGGVRTSLALCKSTEQKVLLKRSWTIVGPRHKPDQESMVAKTSQITMGYKKSRKSAPGSQWAICVCEMGCHRLRTRQSEQRIMPKLECTASFKAHAVDTFDWSRAVSGGTSMFLLQLSK